MPRRNRFGGGTGRACNVIQSDNLFDIGNMLLFFKKYHKGDSKHKKKAEKFYDEFINIKFYTPKPIVDLFEEKKELAKMQMKINKRLTEINKEITYLQDGLEPIKDDMREKLKQKLITYYCHGDGKFLEYDEDDYYDMIEQEQQEEQEQEEEYLESYFGRNKVHFGRRGGKYIIKKGKKVYLN